MSSSTSRISASPSSSSPQTPTDRLQGAWRRGWTPPPRLTVPAWADRYRYLAREAGSTTGRWRTSTVEVARGPMLAVTEPGVHTITVKCCTQLLKTALLENVFGFFAHLDPCPMLLLQPKEAAAEQFSKERVTPMVRATPVLRQLIGTSKTRSAEETLLFKGFPGGFLALAGAGSPDNLARRPIRVLLCDEVDKYPVTREGDPIMLAEERTATFGVNWMSIRACSPTIEHESRIDASYREGDQRLASVACPHCAHRLFLDFFRHVEWGKTPAGDHEPDTARIYCEACGAQWAEGQRLQALSTIRWHQTRPFRCCGEHQVPLDAYHAAWRERPGTAVEETWRWWSGDRWAVYRAICRHCRGMAVPNDHASFEAGKLYSPWSKDRPQDIARKYLDAKGDEDRLQAWWNTQLGKAYRRHAGRELKLETLLARGEVWAAAVPDGVAVITVGVDVQDYRVELEIVGWGANEESWSIAHEVIDGAFDQPETQGALDELLRRTWSRADGRAFAVSAACIDSGGHHTQAVYAFARERLGRKVWAIKGESAQNGERNPVWPTKRPSARSKATFRPIIIGVNAAKDTILARLGQERPERGSAPGYMHFPADRDLAYYAQLTAERIVVREVNRKRFRVWEQIPGRANEALDCRVYAYAALCGLLYRGLKLNRRAAAVGALEPAAPEQDSPEAPSPEAAPPARPAADRQRAIASFMSRFA